MLTNEQRRFHQGMNDAISNALDDLRHAFDIEPRDIAPDEAEWDTVRAELKSLLLKAYKVSHSV